VLYFYPFLCRFNTIKDLLQYGGPDGELGASMRYLSQKYAMSNRKVAGLLNDIGIS